MSLSKCVYVSSTVQKSLPLPPHLESLAAFASIALSDSYNNKDLENALKGLDTGLYNQIVSVNAHTHSRAHIRADTWGYSLQTLS